jgi:hypothetical protein
MIFAPLFNITASARIALLAYSAYCGLNVNSAWNCYWCDRVPDVRFVDTFGDAAGAGFGYVAIDLSANAHGQRAINVVWRGTDNWVGWLADGHVGQTALPWGTGQVHAGFLGAYGNASADMFAVVKHAMTMCPTCDVAVSGHSLGAALAVLCASDLALRITDRRVSLWTYGGPRVGDPAFVQWFVSAVAAHANVTVRRHVWEGDIVPHAPSRSPWIGPKYAHVPFEVYTPSGNSNWRVCDGSGEDPTCSDQLKFWQWSVVDHGFYFGVDILVGIPFGCLYTDPMAGNNTVIAKALLAGGD